MVRSEVGGLTMPELPEVETMRRGLEELVVGKQIEHVSVLWPRIVEMDSKQFESELVGQSIEQVMRRGKFLIFILTRDALISHLRMEGKYELTSIQEPITKHTHVVFDFTDGSSLRYMDVRKFGRMALVPNDEWTTYSGITKLGPEPTIETFDSDDFEKALKNYKKPIKSVLLEQKVVTGLGNIYADEVLFDSKIHPLQPANTLTDEETLRLHQSIIEILACAVEARGTTIRTYKNAFGENGTFQSFLKVYGQTGEMCPRCGTPIEKIKVAQRGTHFCPHCQVIVERNQVNK